MDIDLASALSTPPERSQRARDMQFDTNIAVVLRDDLAVWQKTNVTARLHRPRPKCRLDRGGRRRPVPLVGRTDPPSRRSLGSPMNRRLAAAFEIDVGSD
jgi:hypothetical protein